MPHRPAVPGFTPAAEPHQQHRRRRPGAVAAIRPGAIPLYLGEGAPLYAAGLGTVSLCPLPTYLLQAGDAQHPDLLDLDKHLMYGQILTFARAIQALDTAPSADL